MSSVKQFNSNLVIQVTSTSSNITLDAETVKIPQDLLVAGDFTVLGTTTSIETTNTTLRDNIIVLNQGDTGNSGVTLGTSGVAVYRGANVASYPSAGIIWNETIGGAWQITSNLANPSTYATILSVGGIGLTALFDDKNPVLGGNVNVNGFALTANVNATVMVGGNLQLVSTVASNTSTTLYATTPGNGNSGLFVINQAVANEELVTKKRAFAFSLIL
jgi:hypothetical protein